MNYGMQVGYMPCEKEDAKNNLIQAIAALQNALKGYLKEQKIQSRKHNPSRQWAIIEKITGIYYHLWDFCEKAGMHDDANKYRVKAIKLSD
jgi:hypothetical protein